MQTSGVVRAPVIDGKLDDAAWQSAQFVSDFVQKQPIEGGAPSQRTEIAVVHDSQALYVGARMYIDSASELQAVMTRQDNTGTAEYIIISLDTFHNRRTAFSFAVTAAGVRADWYHYDDNEAARDYSFNPVWSAATSISENQWTAEVRIPFTQLRFKKADEQIWGININRYIPQRNEDIYWVPVPKDRTGWASYFGDLRGLTRIRQPLRIEFLPYVLGGVALSSSELVQADDPFSDQLGFQGRAGLDVKMGLGPGLTLDATVSPDFGQVEEDPAEVNLTAYETFFPERRPFFTEGSEVLQGLGPGYYYSRRIGGPPHGRAIADYVEQPEAARILGAAKLTGRLPSDMSIGALAAVTSSAHARTYDAATDTFDRVLVEPLTGYGVLRLQKEFGPYSSVAGASLTAMHRDLDAADPLALALTRQAIAGGVDWKLRFAGAAYEASGHLGFSHIRGEPDAILARSLNPVHYFQRPDQDHVTLEPGKESLSGMAGAMRVTKRNGRWLWHAGTQAESPGFDPNDMGRLLVADNISLFGGLTYQDNVPGPRIHSWQTSVNAQEDWNFGGAREAAVVSVSSNIVWENFWALGLSGDVVTPGVNDAATRGGPLLGEGWGGSVTASLRNSAGARSRWNVILSYLYTETGYRGLAGGASLTLQPLDRLKLSFAPSYQLLTNQRQYVDTCGAACAEGNPATYDARYIFSTIAIEQLSLQTRLQVAFTPSLSLEAYAEPFVSSGQYASFGELPAPRSRDLSIYGEDIGAIERIDPDAPTSPEPCVQSCVYRVTAGNDVFDIADPDFAYFSLRSTLVLRWEFLPGSTLFAVWQQDRADFAGQSTTVTPLSLGSTLAAPGQQVVLIKLAYWWTADHLAGWLRR